MGLAEHWDTAYADGGDDRSWTEEWPARSLEAIEAVAPAQDAPILDVGGGASQLAGALLAAGYRDVTVLDLSTRALQVAQDRLGGAAERIHWIAADLLSWEPPRRYALWHDRAVLHFFTDPGQRRRYAEVARAALEPGGHAVIATFAPDAPDHCSGLPVQRSSAAEILELLGPEFTLVEATVAEHRTPKGRVQPFTWVTAARSARPTTISA